MSTRRKACTLAVALPAALMFAAVATADTFAQGGGGGGGGRPSGESYGNNLSFPVIWAEGVAKTLRGDPGMVPVIDGAWWWWWGTDAVSGSPLSCAPDPDNAAMCDDGVVGTVGLPPGSGAIKVYLQKDEFNVWQAGTVAATGPVLVDWIDWGDNLESVDWTIRSQVRTEIVLIEDLSAPDPVEPPGFEPFAPLLEYGMRHVSGWGINEVHGLATIQGQPEIIGDNAIATVYSHCARLTIQRLNVEREDPDVANLVWVQGSGWVPLPGYEYVINPPIYDGAVWEGGDGPGYYSAEINVKGKVIYGYTWNVRQNNEGVGDYRITFSLEPGHATPLNTYFVQEVTGILEPLEEETDSLTDEEPGGGGVGVIDFANNLTYMDVRIVGKTGGGGKKK